jgi:hypothetical protein
LSLASHEPIGLSAAFPRMTGDGDVYHVTDLALASLADGLASASPPLVTLGPAASVAPLDRQLVLTAAGRDVLAGRLDRVALCGVDQWCGGVHLQGRSRIWRWDDRAQRVTRERL